MSAPTHSPAAAIIGIVITLPGYVVAKWVALATMTPDQFTAWIVAICGAIYTVGWTTKSLVGLFNKPPEEFKGPSFKPRHRGTNMREDQEKPKA